MKARILWADPARDVFLDLPEREQAAIDAKLELLERFPMMYPVIPRGRFRRHRRFVGLQWMVYYRVVENRVYIRGLWPAHIP